MGQTTSQIAEGRAHTDASLVAERAGAEASGSEFADAARKILDYLIDRDRITADRRLQKFRTVSDGIVSEARLAAAVPDSAVCDERDAADARQAREREMADAALLRERIRSDVAVEVERSEQDALALGQDGRRHDTDEQLSIERRGSDSTAKALGETRCDLEIARTEGKSYRDVLAMVSHDVRTPLAIISLNAEAIGEDQPSGLTHERAQAIVRAAARIERLLTDLLDIARIEAGILKIVRRPHDVLELLKEIHLTYEPLFLARGVSFSIKTPQQSTVLYFDHDRIVQVLSNLLGNAMKFTDATGAVALNVYGQGSDLMFVVSDTGQGIAQDALPHIFEKFWQLDDRPRRGLGLGLHICDKIVRAHGGAIWASSEIGKGATFRFTLPVR